MSLQTCKWLWKVDTSNTTFSDFKQTRFRSRKNIKLPQAQSWTLNKTCPLQAWTFTLVSNVRSDTEMVIFLTFLIPLAKSQFPSIYFQGCAAKYLTDREIFTGMYMNRVLSPWWQKEKAVWKSIGTERWSPAEGARPAHPRPLHLGRSFLSPSKWQLVSQNLMLSSLTDIYIDWASIWIIES